MCRTFGRSPTFGSNLAALSGLFEQVLRVALEAGALRLARVALDGTKVKANASKHKAMSSGRMDGKARQLRAEVKHLLTQAEATDADEDRRHGPDRAGDDVPAELRRRESRLQRLRLPGKDHPRVGLHHVFHVRRSLTGLEFPARQEVSVVALV